MTVKQASEQLLEIVENKRQEGEDSLGINCILENQIETLEIL